MLKKFKLNISALILILAGSIVWSLIMFKSGLLYSFGIGFWGPNGHDGIWHIALIKSLARGSWEMPVFSGEIIKNYHIGFDLILAFIHKLALIPVETLYFQIVPPLLALGIGVSVYLFVLEWKKSKFAAFWATFFIYFGGSFGWILTYLREKEFSGESLFWSQQSISTLINPPFALSQLVIFIGLLALIKGLKEKNNKLLILASFLFGVLVQIKIYAGILVLGGLFVGSLIEIFKRNGTSLLKVFAGAAILSTLIFVPLNPNPGSSLVFKPFWFLETMMGLSDRFNWPKFYEAMINYKYGHVWLKAIIAYSLAFLIFIVGNLGTRIIGFIYILKKLRNLSKVDYLDAFIFILISGGIVLPIFLLQSGTPWNTIQFFYYSLMFFSIIAGISLGQMIEKNKKLFAALIVILAIPTSIATLRNYLPSRPPAKISLLELEALKFLSDQPQGVVLTYPFDRLAAQKAENNPPRPLYLYESTAYVSAYSGKPVFLEDEVNLDITGYDWHGRRSEVENFLRSLDHQFVYNFLRENNITYVYWVKGQRARLGEGQLGMTRVFENKEVDIYKVNKSTLLR